MNRKKKPFLQVEKIYRNANCFQGLIREALRISFAKILNDQLLPKQCQSYGQEQADNIYPH